MFMSAKGMPALGKHAGTGWLSDHVVIFKRGIADSVNVANISVPVHVRDTKPRDSKQ